MASDALEKVKEAELKAGEIRREAAEKAKQIKDKANTEGVRLCDSTLKEAEASYKAAVKKAGTEAAAYTEKQTRDAEKEAEALKSGMLTSLEKSTDFIIRRFTEEWQ